MQLTSTHTAFGTVEPRRLGPLTFGVFSTYMGSSSAIPTTLEQAVAFFIFELHERQRPTRSAISSSRSSIGGSRSAIGGSRSTIGGSGGSGGSGANGTGSGRATRSPFGFQPRSLV
jgi:hypothetical protein